MMGIPATYVSATSFTVEGEYDCEYPEGRVLQANQGIDGIASVSVDSASYDGDTDLTTVAVNESSLTSNLVSIKKGVGDKTSIGKHYHLDNETDAGKIPAADFTEEQVTALQAFTPPPDPAPEDDLAVLGVDAGQYAFREIALLPDPSAAPDGQILAVKDGLYILVTPFTPISSEFTTTTTTTTSTTTTA
jgi:hypothetical protein